MGLLKFLGDDGRVEAFQLAAQVIEVCDYQMVVGHEPVQVLEHAVGFHK